MRVEEVLMSELTKIAKEVDNFSNGIGEAAVKNNVDPLILGMACLKVIKQLLQLDMGEMNDHVSIKARKELLLTGLEATAASFKNK